MERLSGLTWTCAMDGSDPRIAGEDPMGLVYLGSGDYAGLRFDGSVTTIETPGTSSGQIESIK